MLLLRSTSSLKSARTSAMICRGEYSMYTLSGHVPEHVPHWMQLSRRSHPGTAMISLPKPRTRSASYLTVRVISIGRAFVVRFTGCSVGNSGSPPAFRRSPEDRGSQPTHSLWFGELRAFLAPAVPSRRSVPRFPIHPPNGNSSSQVFYGKQL